MSTINFAIDLGTTNSLIAKFNRGNVEVFKNPTGFKETLPSVVAFRNDRILVGEQARTYAEKDPSSVAARFKRKMGTTETIKVKSLNVSKTPTELSAFVLKELRSFIRSGENPEGVVITIPASFDTIQSNATEDAGYQAGFKQVLLLQEPIAASLAYANKEKDVDLRNSQWIVYDLGGGTFDVALVRIVEGELTVVDHEGDNFLGGSDFDAMIVEKIIAPALSKRGTFADLVPQMKSQAGRYNRLWYSLLYAAEAAKIELSNRTSAEVELRNPVEDDNGKAIDFTMDITRSEVETLIKDVVDRTADMLKKILTRNSLRSEDVKFILMVGGSTYIPFVRKRIEELLEIPVNTGIDPTNAVAVGAAYFAATKELKVEAGTKEKIESALNLLTFKVSYDRTSQEVEAFFSAKPEGEVTGLFYRITRDDGAFDSGLKKVSNRIFEDLPLQKDAYNLFTFRVFDAMNNPVATNVEPIQIAQGKYSVAGQPLPDDLSLVKDDPAIGDTRLEGIFKRNSILPAKTKLSVEVGKTLVKGSNDELRIMVVEGPSENHSTTNKPIGILLITGNQISRDLLRGTDIDLTFEMSESRHLTVSAYVNGTGQEFSQVFDPKPRAVPVKVLESEIHLLEANIEKELAEARAAENYDVIEDLEELEGEVQELVGEATLLSIDDVTDDRFKLEDKKRKFAQALHLRTSGKKLHQARSEYLTAKQEVMELVNTTGNDKERHQLAELLARDHSVLNSTNPTRVQGAISAFEMLRFQILNRMPEFLSGLFSHLVERRAAMNDQLQAKNLIENGKRHIDEESWDDLRQVVGRLWNLLPEPEQQVKEFRYVTGIV
jgi:molecular chaperone DnaK